VLRTETVITRVFLKLRRIQSLDVRERAGLRSIEQERAKKTAQNALTFFYGFSRLSVIFPRQLRPGSALNSLPSNATDALLQVRSSCPNDQSCQRRLVSPFLIGTGPRRMENNMAQNPL
jgi:hypothetical protein